jgi:hypothetical protein
MCPRRRRASYRSPAPCPRAARRSPSGPPTGMRCRCSISDRSASARETPSRRDCRWRRSGRAVSPTGRSRMSTSASVTPTTSRVTSTRSRSFLSGRSRIRTLHLMAQVCLARRSSRSSRLRLQLRRTRIRFLRPSPLSRRSRRRRSTPRSQMPRRRQPIRRRRLRSHRRFRSPSLLLPFRRYRGCRSRRSTQKIRLPPPRVRHPPEPYRPTRLPW